MAGERTFAIIKPDAVKKKVAGQILARIEESGLDIVAMKKMTLTELSEILEISLDNEQAMTMAQQALKVYQRLAQDKPKDQQAQFDLATISIIQLGTDFTQALYRFDCGSGSIEVERRAEQDQLPGRNTVRSPE